MRFFVAFALIRTFYIPLPYESSNLLTCSVGLFTCSIGVLKAIMDHPLNIQPWSPKK